MSLESVHFVLKYVGWIGIVLVAMSTIGLQITTSRLEVFKSQKINDLIEGKDILIEKVGAYQKQLEEKQMQIDALSKKSVNSERGVRKTFAFNGQCRLQQGNKFGLIVGEESSQYNELVELFNAQKWNELIVMTGLIVKNNEEWLTPYFFRGLSYASLDDFDSAERDLAYVVSRAGDDPEYKNAAEALAKVKECQVLSGKAE